MPDQTIFLLSSETLDMGTSTRCLRLTAHAAKLTDSGEVRNFVGSSFDREPLADLTVSAQHDGVLGTGPYGWRVEYAQPYAVDLARAEEMVKVLRKVERGLARIAGELGAPESYAALLARVAHVLGARGACFGWRASNGAAYASGETFRFGDADSLRYHVDSLVADFAKVTA